MIPRSQGGRGGFVPPVGQAANPGVGVWRPGNQRRVNFNMLARGTWHAVVDSYGNVYSSRTEFKSLGRTREGLYLSQLHSDERPIELRSGALVPRPISNSEWPWLLLTPGSNEIQVSFMRIEQNSPLRKSQR